MLAEIKPSRRTLRIRQVADKLGIAESSIWRFAQRGDFPKPLKLSPGCTVWYEHEIDAWLDAKGDDRKEGIGRALGGTA